MNGLIGEYKKHLGTIIMYPSRNDIWRDNAIYMQRYVCNLAEIISKYEKVFIFCHSEFVDNLKNKYANIANIAVISSEYDDIWARDVGPTFIQNNGEIECVDWRFNAWGGVKEGSYYPWDKDDAFAAVVADYFSLKCKKASIVVEGGAIISDGVGTLFSTKSVLLNRNRNPFKSKQAVEEELLKLTKSSRIVWFDQGLALDETNGHIDNLMSFVSQREICLAWTDQIDDPNYTRLHKIYESLEKMSNLCGDQYTIYKIPMPPTQHMHSVEADGLKKTDALERKAGDVLPASYLNLYILNGAVLVPSFGCETDEVAMSILKKVFVDRDIIQVYSREPLLGGGGIHCILHEVPLMDEETL